MKRLILFGGLACLALVLISCAQVTPAAQPTRAPAQPTAAAVQPTTAAAQPTTAAKGPKYHRFAFLVLQSGTKRYFGADVPNFTQVAKDAGYEVIAQSAENDAKTQVSQAENVLTQGIDV